MTEQITFTLDGKEISCDKNQTIWEIAKQNQSDIPHLCYQPQPGYRADGNCRACMVEIEGERVLAASCLRKPTPGMVVHTKSQRAQKTQKMIFELLSSDLPEQDQSPDKNASFWQWNDIVKPEKNRFAPRKKQTFDVSHTAMQVMLDACIQCGLCVRACREVQVNDVIGMANRGSESKIVFDQNDLMGESTCVACGECVQACPTGALQERSLVDETGVGLDLQVEKTASVCPYCGVGCQIEYQTHKNKIVAVEGKDGPANSNRLCVKGRFGFDYVNHPHRLTKPLIRIVDKSSVDVIDPQDPWTHFREASWEEALNKVAQGFIKIKEDHGGSALAGFGSAKCTNEEAYLFQKLIRTGFETNNVDHCTRLCHASSVAALLECVGSGAVSASFNAVKDADCIIVIGANPTSNHPVAATFFKQAAKRAKLIVMDPRGIELKRHATQLLQFKPGSDVALLNAMLHVIVAEEIYDAPYVEKNLEGFNALKEHVKDFSPEKMSQICGIQPNDIRQAARSYALSKSSIIFWGMGISQHTHGTDNARCLISLALITGHIGRPGTGLHPLRGQNNVQGASDAGLIPMMLPDYQPVEVEKLRLKFEEFWKTPIDSKQGLTVVEIMDAIHDDKVNGMYIMGENPAMSDPDANHARQALASLKHLVVQDIFLTETAFYADVVLPASAWPEKTGTVTNTNRQIQIGRIALDMPDDARPDWWIIQEIAKRIGLKWNYQNPKEVFSEMTQIMPSLNNISWERLEQEGSVTYPCESPNAEGKDIVFVDGLFPTSTGKGKLVPASLIPPDEVPDKQYPFVLTTGRQLEHWHTGSMTRRSAVLDNLEPEAVALFSPNTLLKANVTPGEKVRIFTRRGEIDISTRSESSIPDDMIFIPFCYAEAAANILTNPALDPFGKIPEFKFCAAKFEKVTANNFIGSK